MGLHGTELRIVEHPQHTSLKPHKLRMTRSLDLENESAAGDARVAFGALCARQESG